MQQEEGGIPVVKSRGKIKGVEAVIDKDFATVTLAKSLRADYFIILTSEDFVYKNYGEKNQEKIWKMNVKEAKILYDKGHFKEGSMGPKILAAIEFLKMGGEKVIITSPKKIEKALLETYGTIVTKR